MPLAKHLTRREGTYYFRIRVPRKLLSCVGRNEIVYSLSGEFYVSEINL